MTFISVYSPINRYIACKYPIYSQLLANFDSTNPL